RESFEAFSFTEGVNSIDDLKVGMKLPGLVTNITNFGAFVDIGVHQDGLVHLSQLANRFVKDPNEVVKVNQQVEVRVTEVDIARKRIALSMKDDQPKAAPKAAPMAASNPAHKAGKPAQASRGGQKSRSVPAKESASDMAAKLAALQAKFK